MHTSSSEPASLHSAIRFQRPNPQPHLHNGARPLPRRKVPRRPRHARSLARPSQKSQPQRLPPTRAPTHIRIHIHIAIPTHALDPNAGPLNPRLRLLLPQPIPLRASPRRPRPPPPPGHRPGNQHNPPSAPHRRGPQQQPARQRRAGHGRRQGVGELDLPVRANVLRRHEAQVVFAVRARHADHCADPQRGQRARVGADQGLGGAVCERVVRGAAAGELLGVGVGDDAAREVEYVDGV